MWRNKIDLSKLISESNGDASLSRLQFLIFTFVISLSLFLIVVGTHPYPAWPKDFPPEILTLLGISGSSYLVSKAIQVGATPLALTISGPTDPLPPGATAAFTVSSSNAPSGTALPQVTWSLDAPAQGTIATAPPDKVTYTAPAISPGAGTKVTLRAQASGFGDGTATITLTGPAATTPRPTLVVSAPPAAPLAPGATANFTVSVIPMGTTLPPVTWSLEAPAHGTLAPVPPDKATYTAPATSPGPGTAATVHATAAGFDSGAASLMLA
jgi:hypothetical protein